MPLKNIFILLIFFVLADNYVHAIIPERTGWWKFDDPGDLLKPETGFGVALDLTGTNVFSTGPEEGNGAVLIGPGSYYKMKHGIHPAGAEIYVNEYSLQFDFKVPSNGIWHSFFQTSIKNNNDGDFFINPSGNIGVAAVGYSGYSVISNEWYRLIISVKNGNHFTCYLDGNLLMSGATQSLDGRFALDSLLLIFADDNAEDGNIYCSELAIWNQALSATEAKELGGFGHDFSPFVMTRIPFLQGQGTNSMNICWHDTSRLGTKVNYGLDSSLSLMTAGSNELISDPFRWHSVKLSGLTPNTRYFYKVMSGNGESAIYSFKTLPDTSYRGKIRFILFSDTHCPDTTMAGKVLRAARAKVTDLYGPDIENHVNGIFHSGDIVVSGGSPGQYTEEFFQPFSALSANIPTMTVAGNHEGENPYFYSYMKLDDQSAYPNIVSLNEKIWQMRVGNSVFIGLNTNIISQYGTTEANWLDSKLKEVEKDSTIDFVFLFFHHPPFSELWFDVLTLDGGPYYVENVLFPIIKKYTKVQQIHTGHTHGFERGTILSDKPDADFRIVCGGGGGGAIDSWGAFTNYDYNDIHISIDHYFFQILEIDIADHSYVNTMYSLGDLNKSRNSEALDSWYKKKLQTGPATPVAENVEVTNDFIQFFTSPFSGSDSLMTVELQVIDSSATTLVILDSLANWKNIYGRDNFSNPNDKNKGINLCELKISASLLATNGNYYFRVRYRDQNLKWSNWSNSLLIKSVGIDKNMVSSDDSFLQQNYPNPFQKDTKITYVISEKSEVNFRIYDTENRTLANIKEGIKKEGRYELNYAPENLSNGVYFYNLTTGNKSVTKKMIKIL